MISHKEYDFPLTLTEIERLASHDLLLFPRSLFISSLRIETTGPCRWAIGFSRWWQHRLNEKETAIQQIHHFDLTSQSFAKEPKSERLLLHILFKKNVIHNQLPAHTTSCSRSLSLLSHSWSTSLPLHLHPRVFFHPSTTPFPNASSNASPTFPTIANLISFLISFGTLCSGSKPVQVLRKDIYVFVQFHQLRREEWQNQHISLYGALERKVRDRMQRRYISDHVFPSRAPPKAIHWNGRSRAQTKLWPREMFCLYLVARRIEVLDPWSMMSEVRKEEQMAEDFVKGWLYRWKVRSIEQAYLCR